MLKKRYSVFITIVFFVIFFIPAFNSDVREILKTSSEYRTAYMALLGLFFPFVAGCSFSYSYKDDLVRFSGKKLEKYLKVLLFYRFIIWREVVEDAEIKLRKLLEKREVA